MRLLVAIQLFTFVAGSVCGQELELSGPFVQGGLVQGRTDPGASVKVDGAPVRVSKEGLFLVGFDRDEGAQVKVEVRTPDGAYRAQVIEVEPREYEIQRIDGLP